MTRLRPLLLAATLVAPAAAQDLQADETAALTQQDWGWLMAVSGVLTAAAGSSMLVYGHGESERLRWQPAGAARDANQRTADDWTSTGAVTLGVGTALLASGVLLWVFDEGATWQLGGGPTGDGAAVSLGLRF